MFLLKLSVQVQVFMYEGRVSDTVLEGKMKSNTEIISLELLGSDPVSNYNIWS